MQIDDLNNHVLERVKAHKPFVLYRLSGDEKLFYLEADAVKVLAQFSLDTCGFLFHPFDAVKHNIELIEGEAHELSLSAFKGFELTYYFASVFSKHARVFVEDPADVLFTPLNDLEFKAIKTKGPEGPIDYYENKKLYLLRRLNGVSISQ